MSEDDEVMVMPTIYDLLEKPMGAMCASMWIGFTSSNGTALRCYTRYGKRLTVTEGLVITLATFGIDSWEIEERDLHGTGVFREFHNLVKQTVLERGFKGIYVENVINPSLPEVLTRYGYHKVHHTEDWFLPVENF